MLPVLPDQDIFMHKSVHHIPNASLNIHCIVGHDPRQEKDNLPLLNFYSNSQLPEHHPGRGIVPPGCVSVETTVIITRILVGRPFPCHIPHNPTSMPNSTNRFKAFREEFVDTGVPNIYLRIQEAQYVGHIPE